MTLPIERTRAVLQTKKFLMDLCNVQTSPRVPKRIREQARSLLRHYPSLSDFEHVEQGWVSQQVRNIVQCPFATKDSLLGDLK